MGKKLDLIGQKFNYLLVEKYAGQDSKKNTLWLCLCKCGKYTTVKGAYLKNNHVKSCGCLKNLVGKKHKDYTGGQYVGGNEFNKIKQSALVRNLQFCITIKDIEDQYEKQNKKCFYTNKKLSFNSPENHGGPNKKGIIYGNASVDRIDSDKGYLFDNIQIVDKEINFMKQRMSHKKFLKTCKIIVNKFSSN